VDFSPAPVLDAVAVVDELDELELLDPPAELLDPPVELLDPPVALLDAPWLALWEELVPDALLLELDEVDAPRPPSEIG
jgi:hypothetical protein